VAGEVVAAGQGGRDVLLAGDRGVGTPDGAGRGQDLAAAQQRLARHAGPVGALTADQLALHEDRAQAAPDGDVGDVLPGRARAEHDDVVGLLLSGHPVILSVVVD
jgi:hypothetical protein